MGDARAQAVMRGLIKVWTDFAGDLDTVPVIDKLLRSKFRIDDYRQLLVNHRQQVIEGCSTISQSTTSVILIHGRWLRGRTGARRKLQLFHRAVGSYWNARNPYRTEIIEGYPINIPVSPFSTLQAGFRLMLHGLDAENLYGFIKHMREQQRQLISPAAKLILTTERIAPLAS